MTKTHELLLDYARNGSEASFRELVGLYTDLVYSTAVRLVNGDTHLAQDITQNVFIDLARVAGSLSENVMLGGWLHRHTCFVASKIIRGETRRRLRERQAAEMNPPEQLPNAAVKEMAPLIDEAINQLNEEDRAAIVLRFFEQRNFTAVGEALGSSEDTAQKRVSRALDKLQGLLKSRGVALSAASLGTILTGEAVTAAPSGLAPSIATIALTKVSAGALAGGASLTAFKTAAFKVGLALTGGLLLAGGVIIHRQSQTESRVRDENSQLRNRIQQANGEAEQLSNRLERLAQSQASTEEQQRELLRLRGEVGVLKRELAEKARQRQVQDRIEAASASADPTNSASPDMKRARDAKILGYAFRLYALNHHDLFPTNFADASAYVAEALRSDLNPGDVLRDQAEFIAQVTNQFEIVYRGTITNADDSDKILFRAKQAIQSPSGSWVKAYGLVNGVGQLHEEADGNFEPWERQHMASLGADHAGP